MNEQPENIATESKELLRWTTHPVKRKPWLSVAVTSFILVMSLIVHYILNSSLFTVLALVALFASLSKFYLPTYFQLTDKTVSIKTTTQTITKEWSQYRSFYPDRNGVLISPFVEPSRLENFRGIYLMFDNNRDEVLTILKKYVLPDNEGPSVTLATQESKDKS